MEALGLVLSVAPLLGGSVKIARFYRRWKRVHDDLDRAAARVKKLQTICEALSILYDDLPEQHRQLVSDPTSVLASMSKSLPMAITKRSKKSRLRWLTGDKAVFVKRVSEAEEDISMAGSLLLIQWLAAQTTNTPGHDLSLPTEDGPEPQEIGITATEAGKWPTTKENGPDVSLSFQYFSYAGILISRVAESVFDLRNIFWSIVSSIPFLRFVAEPHGPIHNLSQLIICTGSIVPRLVQRRWLKTLPDQSRLLMSHEVSSDHEFLKACREGDVVRMQQLLILQRASPFDTTAEGITPLCLAIQYGQHEAVRLLLSKGALVNRAFGVKQTTPLCWALKHRQLEICRTLLFYGASFDHSTVRNWSPLYYLWPGDMPEGFRHPPAAEFITMLRAKGEDFHLLHEDRLDTHGWSVMHRAAIFADPGDLQLLMDYGVDVFQPFDNLRWTSLHLVTKYGICDNLPILFRAYEKRYGWDSALELRDSRGWTPLHMAISNGHFELVRTLLELGADRNALTHPVEDGRMPQSIRGKRCSPEQLAWAFGVQHGQCFDDIVADIPEDHWSDAPEYRLEDGAAGAKPLKLSRQLSREVVENATAFIRRCRRFRRLLG